MTSEYDDDQTRSRPEVPAKKPVNFEICLQMIPYVIGIGLCAYAFIFAPIQAAWVASGFVLATGLHFGIKMQLEDNRRTRERAVLQAAVSPVPRYRPAIPYHPDMVEAYMREGRGYWVRHYQHEGMANSQDDIEFAEIVRKHHLAGHCDRKSCYFCHFHDLHAPYV